MIDNKGDNIYFTTVNNVTGTTFTHSGKMDDFFYSS